MCDGLEQNEIVRVGKNSGPVLGRLWTRVHIILEQRRRPVVLFNALARLSTSRFFQKIFAIKCRSRRKNRTNVNVFWPTFSWGGAIRLFYSRLLAQFTIRRLAKFGWVLFANLRLRTSQCEAWQWSRMQNLWRVGKMHVEFEAVCGLKFMTFSDDVGDPL